MLDLLTTAYHDIVSGLYIPATASAADRPCQLRQYHWPPPVVTEGHHQRPVYLQNRLYGHIQDKQLIWLCGTDHDSVHAWLYWLLGERRESVDPGRLVKAEAVRTYRWFLAESQRLGK